jgi:outer membrane protein W
MKKYLFLFFTITFFLDVSGQENPKRFAFAKAYFGVDFNYVSSYGESQYINSLGQIENFGRSAYLSPSINIGATHFWGYADIYVSIATANIFLKNDEVNTNTRFGAFTGLRIYPLQLKDYGLSPYIGYKFSPFRYKQENIDASGFKTTNVKSTLDIGIGYRLPSLYFYAGYNKVINPEIAIYVSRTDKAKTTLPSHYFNLGINWMIETTSSANNKVNRHFNEEFSKSNHNGLFLGVGPSSAFQIGSSEYNNELRPFLDAKSQATTYPDLSVGYHFTKLDFITSLAFRPITQTRKAFNFSQKVNRKSLVLEVYKFIGDYHGFVPFIGGGLSYENLALKEVDNGVEITNITHNKITPVITFGWDIRPSKKGDWWLLRTILRYSPHLNIEHLNKNLSLQHLEFNFIQLVVYPQRLSKYKKYSS